MTGAVRRTWRARPWRDTRGFTLIELLVVIVVLGLLVGLVGPRLFGRVGQSKIATARAQIELFGATEKPFVVNIDAGELYTPLADHLEGAGVPVFRRADEAVRFLRTYVGRRVGENVK